jgi:hypothetical protein
MRGNIYIQSETSGQKDSRDRRQQNSGEKFDLKSVSVPGHYMFLSYCQPYKI